MEYGNSHRLSKAWPVVSFVFVLPHKVITVEPSTSTFASSLWIPIFDRNNNSTQLAQHVRSALIRGDTEVTLFNWDHVPSHEWDYIRLADEEIDKERIDAYPLLPVTKKNPDRNGKLEADARQAIETQSWYGLKFEFFKVLAKGGQGYVSLWNVTFDDGSVKKVVIKKALASSFNPEKEIEFHLRYQDAEHTTQVVDLAADCRDIHEVLLEKDRRAGMSFTRGQIWDPKRLGCAVFEYAPYGDVWGLMETLVPKNVRFPNFVLWGIMECYAMGVATVSYTPTFSRAHSTFEKEFKKAVETNRVEDLLRHAKNRWYSTHDVHQDLESLNILLGIDPSHENQPVFKLHDLGAFSESMGEEWKTLTEAKIWSLRHYPKNHAVTPEQISKEWDDLPIRCSPQHVKNTFCGDDFRKGTKCAGRFGTWTNVFLVAKVMASMITGEIQRYPFRPKPHQKADGSMGLQTYGWVLQQQRHSWVDPDLRDLICMCLYENPADRPSPLEILRAIKKWKDSARHDPVEVARWWEYVHGPRTEAHYKPKAPNANTNPIRQAVADRLGLLALYSQVQPNASHANKKNQAVASNQQQRQNPVQGNQPGANPQQVPPPRPRQPPRPTELRIPAKIAGTRKSRVSPQTPAQPVNRPIRSSSSASRSFHTAPTVGVPNFLQRPTNAASPSPTSPAPVPSPGVLTIRPPSPGAPTVGPPVAAQAPSGGIGTGEAMDIDREEAAYRFSGSRRNVAAPILPPAQGQNNTRPGRASDDPVASINRATQRPTRRVRFDTTRNSSEKFRVHKKPFSPKVQKVVNKPIALSAYVQDVMSHMPVAIGNLLSRSKELNAQLDVGAIPVYAHIK
ncbi:hypothetical protein FLONG3_2042 [Fusarium longipes]|uniref:Protein kinase domain-containing protein n=1 Tax=Fusarium longipes TaxID=694270 RepID=A0A395T6C6_9HYPO|nr:hypothetical protein FLONG3_2042 [Fusarium longipes]